jgi:hypothetical protein
MDHGYHQVAHCVGTQVSVCLIPFQGAELNEAGLGKGHEFFNG